MRSVVPGEPGSFHLSSFAPAPAPSLGAKWPLLELGLQEDKPCILTRITGTAGGWCQTPTDPQPGRAGAVAALPFLLSPFALSEEPLPSAGLCSLCPQEEALSRRTLLCCDGQTGACCWHRPGGVLIASRLFSFHCCFGRPQLVGNLLLQLLFTTDSFQLCLPFAGSCSSQCSSFGFSPSTGAALAPWLCCSTVPSPRSCLRVPLSSTGTPASSGLTMRSMEPLQSRSLQHPLERAWLQQCCFLQHRDTFASGRSPLQVNVALAWRDRPFPAAGLWASHPKTS